MMVAMIKRRTQGRWRSGWVGWIAGLFLLAHTVVGQVQVPLAGAGGAVAQPLLPPQAKAALLKIDGTIDRVTLKSLERRVDEARKAGCTLVIYDLQVTGGYMPSALDISAFTKRVTGEQMSVAAWVHGNASGAASVVALACPLIVMADGAGLGSIAAEDLAPAGVAPSPLVTDLEDSAKRAGIDRAVVRAMAIPAVELIAVTNRTTGETRYVDRANEKILLDERIAAPGGEVTRPWAESAVVDGPNSTLTVLSDDALKMHPSRATVNSEADLRATLNVRGDLVKMDLDIF